jgi:hypothetical protein
MAEVPFPDKDQLSYALETRRFGPDTGACRRALLSGDLIAEWPAEFVAGNPSSVGTMQGPDGKGKMSLYHWFMKRKMKEAKAMGNTSHVAELTKEFARQWREMSADERLALRKEKDSAD